MTEREQLLVKIGEIQVTQSPNILKSTLGSCVGIAFLWKAQNRFGLAHCLLPDSNEKKDEIGAKYVTQAIPSLMALMQIQPQDVGQIEVYVAGGGNMISDWLKNVEMHVGRQNVAMAKTLLNQMGFQVKGMDTGGEFGRQMVVDCLTGVVDVKNISSGAGFFDN